MTAGGRLGPVVAALAALLVACTGQSAGPSPTTTPATGSTSAPATAAPRDRAAYGGLGAWVDVFDFAPAYQEPGQAPVITPDDVDVMAALGVRTLYLQAARNDDKTPAGLVAPDLLAAFLARAHGRGIQVVAWYLPKLADVPTDVERMTQLRDFRAGEHRFDGLAVDIEFTAGVEDPALRNARLVEFSQRLRAEVGTDALGAIVLSPVLLEVVNPDFWPGFPWAELAPFYDVWLPMAYWTDRRADSGWRDGLAYPAETTRRIRANLGRADAAVHLVGGLSNAVDEASLRAFQQAIIDTGAVGASLYDYRITSPGAWALVREGLKVAGKAG